MKRAVKCVKRIIGIAHEQGGPADAASAVLENRGAPFAGYGLGLRVRGVRGVRGAAIRVVRVGARIGVVLIGEVVRRALAVVSGGEAPQEVDGAWR